MVGNSSSSIFMAAQKKGVLENWGNNKLNKITIIIANKEAFISIFFF